MAAMTLYKKRWMTINELVQEGFSQRDLKQWVHAKDFPAMKGNAKNSPWVTVQELFAPLIIDTLPHSAGSSRYRAKFENP